MTTTARLLDTPFPGEEDTEEAAEVFTPDTVELGISDDPITPTLQSEAKEISYDICTVTQLFRELCDLVASFVSRYRLVWIPRLFARYSGFKSVVVASRGVLFVGDLKLGASWDVYTMCDTPNGALKLLGLPCNTLSFIHQSTHSTRVFGTWVGPLYMGPDVTKEPVPYGPGTTGEPILYGPPLVIFKGTFCRNGIGEVIHTEDSSRLYYERRRVTHPNEFVMGVPKDRADDRFLRHIAGRTKNTTLRMPVPCGYRPLHKGTLDLSDVKRINPLDVERAIAMLDGYVCSLCSRRFTERDQPRDTSSWCSPCRWDLRSNCTNVALF